MLIRKARQRHGVKLGGTLVLLTILFGLVDRHTFIYQSVRPFFYPNQACGEAERFVSRGDSAGAFPLSPAQRTRALGAETILQILFLFLARERFESSRWEKPKCPLPQRATSAQRFSSLAAANERRRLRSTHFKGGTVT